MVGKSSLIFVVGFGVIMGYIIFNLASLGTRATENVSWYNAATSSKNLATIGINVGLTLVNQEPSLVSGGQGSIPILNSEINSGPYSGGSFELEYEREEQNSPVIILRSISTYPRSGFSFLQSDIKDTISVELIPSGEQEYRMYAWIADITGNPRNFQGLDVVWGPVHSKGGIRLRRAQDDPRGSEPIIFHGEVTAEQQIVPGGNRDEVYFLGGHHPHYTPSAEMPENPIEVIQTDAQYKYDADDGDLFIQIYGDELRVWTNWTNGNQPDPEIDHDVYNISNYSGTNDGLGIYTTENVKIHGTLSGKLAVGSQKNITIVDNIQYVVDGTPDSPGEPYTVDEKGDSQVPGMVREEHIGRGDDILALYSGNEIIIADKNGEDFEIHGIMFAKENINYENHSTRQLAEINTWGSFMMGNRGDMNVSHGIIQKLRYDTRLERDDFWRPFFPGTQLTNLVILSWYESIQLPPF